MSIPELGTLREVELREVWCHEATSFTPWLAANLSELSKLIGIPLEVEGIEVPVGQYFADILARDPLSDRRVLIENQLEPSDHSHLGQLLTYLSGLDVRIIIWIAKDFREPHLSALRWLNDQTDESFAFFAVKVRAVRIGDSRPAPQFEIVCRPNVWEKQLHDVARTELSDVGHLRREFWTHHLDRYPDEAALGAPNGANSRWKLIHDLDLIVSKYIAATEIGVFVRGRRGAEPTAVYTRLATHAERLTQNLGVELRPHSEGRFLISRCLTDLNQRENWNQLSDWLTDTAGKYERELLATFGTSLDDQLQVRVTT